MTQSIREVMKEQDAGVVPVTENGRLIGMVTDRDIAIHVVAEGKDPEVVEKDGRLVGVVAQADAAREGNDTKTGQVVQDISE